MRKLKLALVAAIALLSFHPADAQSPPFNAYSINTLGGNCSAQSAMPYQSSDGATRCTPTGTANQVMTLNGSGIPLWTTHPNGGTVTSVGLTLPSIFSVSGSPVTAAGTLTGTLASQSANTVFAAPNGSAGAPSFRAMLPADFGSQSATRVLASPNGSAGNPTFRQLNTEDANYTPAGTDAVTATARDKLQETVSAFDFMTTAQIADVRAKTLTLDVTTPLQNAINSLPNGGRLKLPRGYYKTTAALTMAGKLGIIIEGDSRESTRIYGAGTHSLITDTATFASSDRGNGVMSLGFHCGGLGNTAAKAISFTYVNAGIIRDIYINGCYRGIELFDQWQTVVDNVRIEGAGADQNYIGVYMGAPTDAANSNPNNAVIMSNVSVQGVSQYGMHLIYFSGSKIVNTEASDGVSAYVLCGQSYVVTIACHFGHFSNMLADTTSGSGIVITQGANSLAPADLMFDNLWIGNSFSSALELDGVTYSGFKGVHISSAANGITTNNSNWNNIEGEIHDYNRANDGSYAATLGNSNLNTLRLTTRTTTTVLGYNGIRETGTSTDNQIWGGIATCDIGINLGGAAVGMTFDSQECEYEVAGQFINLQFYDDLGALGSSTGAMTLTGLPFTVKNSPASNFGATSVIRCASNCASLGGAIIAAASPNTTIADVYTQGATGSTALTNANLTSSSILTGRISYIKK